MRRKQENNKLRFIKVENQLIDLDETIDETDYSKSLQKTKESLINSHLELVRIYETISGKKWEY